MKDVAKKPETGAQVSQVKVEPVEPPKEGTELPKVKKKRKITMPRLAIGRIVRYVPPDAPPMGEVHPSLRRMVPGIVVAVWKRKRVNLQVFTNGPESTATFLDRVSHDQENMSPGTWNWPPTMLHNSPSILPPLDEDELDE